MSRAKELKQNHQVSTKTVIVNAVVTFVEGFLAAWLITGNELSEKALIGAAAAGVSLVYNVVVKPQLKKNGVL